MSVTTKEVTREAALKIKVPDGNPFQGLFMVLLHGGK